MVHTFLLYMVLESQDALSVQELLVQVKFPEEHGPEAKRSSDCGTIGGSKAFPP